MNFKKTTLPNGLRVITVPTKGNPSVTVMVLVEAGSNYETKAQNGLSHFLEHMCFKGTKKRPTALDLSRELNSLGAANNAGTSNELTVYYAKANKKHFKKILDIVADIYLNPSLPAPELEKERGVILQEISMYEDLPQVKVQEVLDFLLYGDTPAGRPIIGSRNNIKKFSRADFVNYRNKHFVAGKTTVVVAGHVGGKEIISEVKKCFKDIPKGAIYGKEKVVERQTAPALKIEKKKTDQTHLVMAVRSFGASDKRVAAINLLATILGRGSSSRLFQKMREEMGACYYVKASASDYTDHGVLAISAGIDAKRSEEVVSVLVNECKKLRDELVSQEELNKAKEACVGWMYLGLETTDALAEFYVDQVVETKHIKTPYELEKEIRKVTARDVMNVAKDIFRDKNLNLAIVGNISDQKKVKKALTFK